MLTSTATKEETSRLVKSVIQDTRSQCLLMNCDDQFMTQETGIFQFVKTWKFDIINNLKEILFTKRIFRVEYPLCNAKECLCIGCRLAMKLFFNCTKFLMQQWIYEQDKHCLAYWQYCKYQNVNFVSSCLLMKIYSILF